MIHLQASRWRRILLCLFALTLSLLPALYADFDDLGAGAQAEGMGGAYCGLADDAFGFYYNPAGPGFMYQGQVGADYGTLWMGLDDNSELPKSFIAASIPFFTTEEVAGKSGSIGVSSGSTGIALSTAAAQQQWRFKLKHWGTVSLGWRSFALVGTYEESAYYLGFARSYKKKWAWGGNVKSLQEKYNIDSYLERSSVFDYGGRSAVQNYSVDAGVMYNVLPRLFIGLAGSDLNQPSLGLLEPDNLPATYRFGAGWRQKGTRWAVDLINRSGRWYSAAGFEKTFAGIFAARGGAQFGGKNYLQPSVGFSFILSGIQLDYVFQIPLVGMKEVSGSHAMSFMYRFGRKNKEDLAPGSLELYYSELQEESMGLKKTLSKTEEEKKRLEEILIEEATMRIKDRIKSAKTETRETRTSSLLDMPGIRETKDIRHLVQKGDTLQSIAEKYYKDSKYWNEIYQANRDSIGRGGVLKPNTVLVIPPLSQARTSSSLDDLPDLPALQTLPAQPPVIAPVKVITITPSQAPAAATAGGAEAPAGPKIIPITAVTVQPASVKPKEEPSQRTQTQQKEKPAAHSRKHVVRPGESLQSIAQKYYNDNSRWKEIYEANRDKVISGQVMPGKEITIP